MNVNKINKVFFLGIGGIGMSALARYFFDTGKEVSGYDLTSTTNTKDLEEKGIHVCYEDDESAIPFKFRNKEDTLVIRTPAVPETSLLYSWFKSNAFEIKKRSEVLGWLMQTKRGIAVGGTHGKTSVTSMLAHILHNSSLGCNAFLGGILKNYNTNMFHNQESDWLIAEADEFDRSFLQLHPEISLITMIDSDHLDIYKSYQEIVRAFEQFMNQTSKVLIVKKGIDIPEGNKDITTYTYSLADPNSDFYAENISIKPHGGYVFNVQTPFGEISGVSTYSLGMTNVENAVAALSIALVIGAEKREIKAALSSFEGVCRRFDIQYRSATSIYIDDYAHHPRELDAIISSIRRVFPNKKITGVFQPHLYSRTRDFADEFAESLSKLDALYLLDIYPARELPIEGVGSEMILKNVNLLQKKLCSKKELIEELENEDFEILLTLGAGDIDKLVGPIKKILQEKYEKV